MRRTKKGWTIALSAILAVAFVLTIVVGVILLCREVLSDDSVSGPKSAVTVYADEGMPAELGVEVIPEEEYEDYGLKYFSGEAAYTITATWTSDTEDKDSTLVDVAGYSWSGSWMEDYDSASETGAGNGNFNEAITAATDYAGDVWNSGGTGYSSFVSFTEASYSVDDGYSVGSLMDESISNTALVNQAFGTPVILTFSIWDYMYDANNPSETADHFKSAYVRFDYQTFFISDGFTLYNGVKDDTDDSEELFSATYDKDSDSFSLDGSPDTTYMTASLDTAMTDSAGLWYSTEGAQYTVGTVAPEDEDWDAESDLENWDMEIVYNGNTYKMSEDGSATNAEDDEDSSLSGATHSGIAHWDDISNAILGTSTGIGDAPIQGFRYSDLRTFDKEVKGEASAMMTITIKHSSNTIMTIGLSFDDYDCIFVGLGDLTVSNGETDVTGQSIVSNSTYTEP